MGLPEKRKNKNYIAQRTNHKAIVLGIGYFHSYSLVHFSFTLVLFNRKAVSMTYCNIHTFSFYVFVLKEAVKL